MENTLFGDEAWKEAILRVYNSEFSHEITRDVLRDFYGFQKGSIPETEYSGEPMSEFESMRMVLSGLLGVFQQGTYEDLATSVIEVLAQELPPELLHKTAQAFKNYKKKEPN
jgi:hypothetical protein